MTMGLMMMVLVLTVAWLLAGVLVFRPLDFLQWLHLPSWLGLAIVFLTISWCLGD